MRVFMWHVHGSYMTALAQGPHDYFVPLVPGRGPDGRGRALTWDWPASVHEVTEEQARDLDVDVVVLQRPAEMECLCEAWLGRRPGADVPAIYLEHNAPQGPILGMRHPAAGQPDLTVVHVTHFNELFWDCGRARTTVVEHGIVDPGYRYQGDLARVAVVVNEARRRGRVTGTDLLARFAARHPLDLFGIDAGSVRDLVGPDGSVHDDVPQAQLHDAMAQRRAYLHPVRWTSLGLSLLEAMHLGMPVVSLATTEVAEAVPADAGVVSNRLDVLEGALRRFLEDPADARATGARAREAALGRFGLDRFLDDWNRLLKEVVT